MAVLRRDKTMASYWQLREQGASLEIEGLEIGGSERLPCSAHVDLHAPHDGIRVCCSGEGKSGDFSILKLQNACDKQRWKLGDSYVRGCDVVAAYPSSTGREIETRVYWRSLAEEQCNEQRGNPPNRLTRGFELIVSLQTDLLDDAPQLKIGSRLPATEVWRVALNGEAAQLELREAAADFKAGVLVFRLPFGPLSYAEFTHPESISASRLEIAGEACETQHWLFEDFLEKGVIRQIRVRGVWLQSGNDLAAARQLYEHWLASEPPLTV